MSTDFDTTYRENGKCGYTDAERDDPCGLAEGWGLDTDSGLCKHHSGRVSDMADNDNAAGNSGGGAPEGNRNAWTTGAFSEHFASDLDVDEVDSFYDLAEQLSTPEGAKQAALLAASEALHKYKRTADARFMREWRQICETFNIAPADELNIEHEHEHVVTDAVDALRDARSMAELEGDVEAGEYTLPNNAE